MKTAVINIKTDPKVKASAQKVASELGFSLSSLINGYLRQLVKTKTINFSLRDEEPSELLIKAIKEAEEERKSGNYYSFAKTDEALEFIDKINNTWKNISCKNSCCHPQKYPQGEISIEKRKLCCCFFRHL